MSGQTKWTCDLCGAVLYATQRGNHVRWNCPKQGRLLRMMEDAATAPPLPEVFLPCLCGCGATIKQVTGRKKKHYVDVEHYEAHRAEARVRRDARDAETDDAVERRLAEEMGPVVARDATTQAAAQAVRLLTGEASFRLWCDVLSLT